VVEVVSKDNQKVIIFEGMDMTGKTKIARALSFLLDIPYFKNKLEHNRGYDTSIALKYQAQYTQDLLQKTGYSVIFDRFWPSEKVYSDVFERPTYEKILRELDMQLSKMNSIIFILEKDKADYEEDKQGIISKEKYDKIKNKFRDFSDKAKTTTRFVNVSEFKKENNRYCVQSEIDEILRLLREEWILYA